MGLLRPQKGEVLISGLPVDAALRRNIVAYVPQSEEVDWNFPVLVEDVVMMGRYGHMGFLRIASAEDRRKVAEALDRVGMAAFRRPPDRRAVGRAEEARVPRPRAGPGGPGDPARRAVHRRRREDRGGHRRADARAARRGPADAGVDPQPGQRARLLRPGGAAAEHGAGGGADGGGLHPGQPGAGVRRHAAPLPAGGHAAARGRRPPRAHGAHRRRAPRRVLRRQPAGCRAQVAGSRPGQAKRGPNSRGQAWVRRSPNLRQRA